MPPPEGAVTGGIGIDPIAAGRGPEASFATTRGYGASPPAAAICAERGPDDSFVTARGADASLTATGRGCEVSAERAASSGGGAGGPGWIAVGSALSPSMSPSMSPSISMSCPAPRRAAPALRPGPSSGS